LRPSALPRALLKKAALPLLLAIGIASPDAHASITGPVPVTLNSAPGNITFAGTNLSLDGFSSGFKALLDVNPLAILTDVTFSTRETLENPRLPA
jgi:hypothetical protein